MNNAITLRIRQFACGALALATLLLPGGCDDFLKRSAQNLVVPKTTAQYKEILQGEGYFRLLLQNLSTEKGYAFLQFMTDDVEFFDVTVDPSAPRGWSASKIGEFSEVEHYINCYRWDVSVESSTLSDKVYLYLYKQAMVANVCLDGLEESEGSETEKEILRGQATFSRAFAYFMLANIYAKPYNRARPEDPCVPLKTSSTPVVEPYSRATIAQVWSQITGDIQTALQNLKGKGLEQNVYEISHPAALILAQRIALYMEDWQRAVEYGREYIDAYAAKYPIYDISHKDTAGSRLAEYGKEEGGLYVEKFINSSNTEVVWSFGSSSTAVYYNIITPTTKLTVPANQNLGKYYRASSKMANSLISTYEQGDRRKNYWFFQPTRSGVYVSEYFDYITVKAESEGGSKNPNSLYLRMALRSAEVWLNLAEALARKPQPEKADAVALLNELRVKRFAPTAYTPLSEADFAATDSLVSYIWTERRRELCFEENHRWWDLRRTTQPRIVHPWRERTAYVLVENDPAYTLNFPEEELTFNGSLLTPNVRPRRTPIPYAEP
ncbi:MAG: RagB/SusD family nutrient uptake outer membrane protein [Prevotellaceae bacterium]|jgi:hypothetical protein|nr:RagB/SusD family nutrient uptake outer membrane protein [Prevotellaceae bacterium]